MRSCSIIKSPARPGHVRLCAEVEYDTPGIKPELYWFEVHERYSQALSTSGNPWLLCLAPAAITLGESLHLNRPVDGLLLKNAHELMKIWSFWFPRLKPMPIRAEVAAAGDSSNDSKTLAFFSGGVDAFFTALYHGETQDPYDRIAIDDLVNVWGLDIPYANSEGYQKIEKSLSRAAADLGKEFVSVATNLRETQLKNCEWEYQYHGPALASVAYALEKRYRLALIASSGGYRATFPHASHPALMPLFSSSGTQIMQSGATFSRVSKIERISRSEAARQYLHVCFHLGNEQNCGRCLKCFRTMLTLDLLGVLEKVKTFDSTRYDRRMAKKMFLWGDDDRDYTIQIRELAIQKDRQDIAKAMDQSIQRTRRIKRSLAALGRLKKFPGGKKLYNNIEHRILKSSIGGEERYYPAAKDSPFFQFNQI